MISCGVISPSSRATGATIRTVARQPIKVYLPINTLSTGPPSDEMIDERVEQPVVDRIQGMFYSGIRIFIPPKETATGMNRTEKFSVTTQDIPGGWPGGPGPRRRLNRWVEY
jgi:hypothetical protein